MMGIKGLPFAPLIGPLSRSHQCTEDPFTRHALNPPVPPLRAHPGWGVITLSRSRDLGPSLAPIHRSAYRVGVSLLL